MLPNNDRGNWPSVDDLPVSFTNAAVLKERRKNILEKEKEAKQQKAWLEYAVPMFNDAVKKLTDQEVKENYLSMVFSYADEDFITFIKKELAKAGYFVEIRNLVFSVEIRISWV